MSFDWWEQNQIPVNIVGEDENGYWVNHNRIAVKSWKRAYYYENPKTMLRTCDLCGKLSTPKKIQYRWCLGYRLLCMGCWNKLVPIEIEGYILNECQTLNNRLLREARKYGKEREHAQRCIV